MGNLGYNKNIPHTGDTESRAESDSSFSNTESDSSDSRTVVTVVAVMTGATILTVMGVVTVEKLGIVKSQLNQKFSNKTDFPGALAHRGSKNLRVSD